MINKNPSIFKLKEWREENGFTTEEWQIYLKKLDGLVAVCYLAGVLSSVVVGIIIGINL